MGIDRIEDVMSYYYFGMIPLYCFAALSVLLLVGSLRKKLLWKYAVLAAALEIFACVSHYFFLGVLADNQAVIGPWMLQTHIFMITGLAELIFLTIKRFLFKTE